METLMLLLYDPPYNGDHYYSNHSSSSPISTIIMMLIIFSIPLSWVIPIIVAKNRKKKPAITEKTSHAKEQIEQLKDLYTLKEQGALTEEEFLEQKNKVLGRKD